MAAVTSNLIRIDPTGGRVMIQTNSDDESVDDNPNSALFADEKQCNTSEETVDDCDNVLQDNNGKDLFKSHLHSSPFAMQNVLRMKKERNSTSPENNVFSTEKLLQNTPCCEETTLRNSPFSERRESISYDGYSPKYNDSLNCQSSSISGDDGDCQNYANCSGNFDLDDDRTCCSDDTVLSVGNEAPGANFNDEDNRTASRPSPVHSPARNLTSFKHIQSHLNAISQLSQNFNQSQHVLLRPNPVAANPLIFLNQSHLLFPQAIDPILGNSLTAAGAIQQMQPNLLQHHSNRLGFGGNFGGINPGAAPMRQFKNQQGSSQMSLVNGQSRTHKEVDQRKTIHAQNETANEETLHQGRLKFSIDNILKADFGRRITDPLTKRKSNHGKVRSANSQNGIAKQSTAYAVQESAYASSKIKDAAFPSAGNSSLIAPSPEKSPSETSRTLDSKFQASAVSKSSAAKPDKSGVMDLSKPDGSESGSSNGGDGAIVWPAWVYCTRYSDRPSSGPRTRRPKKPPGERSPADEKRPRTAFSGPQLARLKHEFNENRYLTERRRQQLASELGLAEAQIKIWFQNKRAKIKKASGQKNPLALQLMAQGLYNHSTVPLTREEEELEMQAREARERNA